MARILVLTRGFPDDNTSGLHLRVGHLCRELARDHQLHLVDFSDRAASDEALARSPFRSLDCLGPPPAHPGSPMRHLRLSNAQFLRRAHPRYYRDSVAALSAVAHRRKADCIINFAQGLAGIPKAIDLPRLLDNTDCATLAIERELENRGGELSAVGRMARRLALLRTREAERDLVQRYNATLTISEPDRRRLLELSGAASDRIILVPNGVADEALSAWREEPSRRRRIVFWGNLDFAPNWTAVKFFHQKVFLPHLVDLDVEWHIAGRNANTYVREAAKHPKIHLAGFRPDLFTYAADAAVMINPMVEGSGLKNKVLEAFAAGVPVVSTSLGVDAFSLTPGVECVVADEPVEIANAVLRLLDDPLLRDRIRSAARQRVERDYTWENVGRHFRSVVARTIADNPETSRRPNDQLR